MTNKLIKVTLSALVATMCMWGTAHGADDKDLTPENKFDISAGDYLAMVGSSRAVISEYDDIIRKAAAEKGFDWRLISAIAMAESRFDHKAVSYAGAVGLMQVMPGTARGLKVSDPKLWHDPETNVSLGVSVLEQIGKTLRFPRSISQRDRLSITLAAYNCGIGHVLDARRLAVKYGENHNSWSVVAKYLKLKGENAYYDDPVVRCGAFRGSGQTLGYVTKVMRYYNNYCEIAML